MIRILVIDDHSLVRQGFIKLISTSPDLSVCGEADSGETGYSVFNSTKPDVVITDLSMQGISGMALLQKILARDKHAKVIVCSMYDNPTLVSSALNSGEKVLLVNQQTQCKFSKQ